MSERSAKMFGKAVRLPIAENTCPIVGPVR